MASVESLRSALLGSAKTGSVLQWFQTKYDKDVDTAALVATLDSTASLKVFAALSKDITFSKNAFLKAEAEGVENDDPTQSGKARDQLASATFFRSVADVMMHYCTDEKKDVAEQTIEVAGHLHEILPFLDLANSATRTTANAIARLCEKLYLQGMPSAQVLLPATVLVLLADVTAQDVSEATIKRLYALRKGLSCFDLDDPDNVSLKDLMLKCFHEARCLGSATGRKLLACIMTAGPCMPRDCHASVKGLFTPGSMPSATVQGWIGEVYCRAWDEAGAGQAAAAGPGAAKGKDSAAAEAVVPELRRRMEQDALQDLLSHGLNAARPDMFEAVRRILRPFVKERDRGKKGMDAGILRVYEPLIWRALTASNGHLRRNAAHLLSDVLLIGSNSETAAVAAIGGPKARAAIMQQQIDALLAMVKDVFPAVRQVAAESISSLLHRHWSSLSASAANGLLAEMMSLAEDSSSPNVRVAALHGLHTLLTAATVTHPVLLKNGHLSTAARLLHDKNERVRLSAVRILEAVAHFKGSFKDSWYNLASTDAMSEGGAEGASIMVQQVFARLTMDDGNEEMALALAGLLAPFYIQQQPVAEAGEGAKLDKAREGADLANHTIKVLLKGLAEYQAATLTFLRYAPRLSPDVAPKNTLAAVGAHFWKVAHKETLKVIELASTLELAAPEARGEESEDGFSRKGKKRVRGQMPPSAPTTTTVPKAHAELMKRTAEVDVLLRSSVTIWDSLLQALPEEDALVAGDGGEGSNPETGGVTTGVFSEGDIVRKAYSSVTADKVALMLEAFSARQGEEEQVPAELTATRMSITLSLLDLASRLARDASRASHKDAQVDLATLSDSQWARLMALTPAEVGISAFLTDGSTDSSDGNGAIALTSLVSCMVAFGRGSDLLANALISIEKATEASASCLSPGGESPSTEAGVLELAGVVGGSAKLVHPILAPLIIEAVLSAARDIPVGAGGGGGMDMSVFTVTQDGEGVVVKVLLTLVNGMTNLMTSLAAGPVACASPAALLAARLAVHCAAAWVSVDSKMLVACFKQGGSSSAIMSQATVDIAENHLQDAVGWLSQALLPMMLTHASAARVGCAEASLLPTVDHAAGYAAVLTASRTVTSLLLSQASDHVVQGLSSTTALQLLASVTGTTGLPSVAGLPGLYTYDSGACTIPPIDWLVRGCQPYETGEAHNTPSPALLSSLRQECVKCHAMAVVLGMKVWGAACDKVEVSYVKAAICVPGEAPTAEEEVRSRVTLSKVEKVRLASILTRMLTDGEIVMGADCPEDMDDPSLAFTAAVAKELFTSMAFFAKGASNASAASAIKCLLQPLLAVVEDSCIPDSTLDALSKGTGVESAGELGCPALAALIQLCVGRQWSLSACVAVLTDRLAAVAGRPACLPRDIVKALAPLSFLLHALPGRRERGLHDMSVEVGAARNSVHAFLTGMQAKGDWEKSSAAGKATAALMAAAKD